MTNPPSKPNPNQRIEGIVTPEAVEKYKDLFVPEKVEQLYYLLKAVEPGFNTEVVRAVADAKQIFRKRGLSGQQLDEVGDALATFMNRGFFLHRTAVSLHDVKKLNELYNADYEAYESEVIDAALKARKAKKITASKVESIEPKAAPRDAGKLFDDGDLA
jgi:hypothetical protein